MTDLFLALLFLRLSILPQNLLKKVQFTLPQSFETPLKISFSCGFCRHFDISTDNLYPFTYGKVLCPVEHLSRKLLKFMGESILKSVRQ